MISSPFILNFNVTHLSMGLLSQSILQSIYLNSITVSVISQGQTDSIYFSLDQAFDKIPHTLLLHTLSNSGLSDRQTNWFQSYLSSTFSVARTLWKYSSPSPTLSGVQQGSTLVPLLFNYLLTYSWS
jgi:hypothetical protein